MPADGTDLNFAEHEGCRGLGLIRKNQRDSGTLGLHMHSTLVVDGEGVPLGVPQIQYEAPEATGGKRKPAGERKTQRWVRGLRECARLASELEGVRPVSVMDREGDSFELFVEQRRLGTVDLLVRAQPPALGQGVAQAVRAGAGGAGAGDGDRGGAPFGAAGNPAAEGEREAGGAQGPGGVALAQGGVGAAQEQRLHKGGPGPSEPGPCVGGEGPRGRPPPLEWFLLTTVAVRSSREAKQVLEWYRLRWRIEEWHRVLKTCKAETLGHQSGDRIERAVTIKAPDGSWAGRGRSCPPRSCSPTILA